METINSQLADRAFQGTSQDPEKRSKQVQDDFKTEIAQDYEMLLTHAPTDEKKALLDEEFPKYTSGYAGRYNKWLGAHGRCISSFITGPANFPVRRAEKANRVEHARLDDLISYRKWALNEIKKKLHPEWRPVMAGDSDAVQRLEEKLVKARAAQDRYKTINQIIRKYAKQGEEEQSKALKAIGCADLTIHQLLHPDYGRPGVPGWELTNNNANIRRMEQRLETISKNQATETTKAEGVNAKYEDCPADNRVRLFFPGKPSEEIRKDLKSSGFRWSPTIGAWQAYRNYRTIEKAKKVAGIESKEV